METQQVQLSVYEKTIISIMHRLPTDKISELVDFAKFLEFEYARKNDNLNPKAKRIMREMAQEALDDYRAGKTTDITITADGRLAPA